MTVVIDPAAPEPTAAEPSHPPGWTDRVVTRLLSQYGQVVGERVVVEQVRDAVQAMAEPRLLHFVPIFVERDARRRIREYIASGRGMSS